MKTKRMIYDEISAMLTEYENEEQGRFVSREDLYCLLVKIQNNWEDVITACDCGNGGANNG